jgi:hypothetical protein
MLIFSIYLMAQESYSSFFEQSMKTQNTGMYILGSWALLNITTGAYGWANYEGQLMYFNQMNMFWNVVNLSIAGAALYGNHNLDLRSMNNEMMLDKHINTEHILLLNAGLDVGYIGIGFLLNHLSGKYPKNATILNGYGNSLLLQGGFLLLFDAVLYGVLHMQRMQFLENINLSLAPNGLGIQMVFTL